MPDWLIFPLEIFDRKHILWKALLNPRVWHCRLKDIVHAQQMHIAHFRKFHFYKNRTYVQHCAPKIWRFDQFFRSGLRNNLI